jgi:glycosyltransferase involved in cell wall biosynthesis
MPQGDAMMAAISAIVPSYNHAAYVGDAVASVLNQTAPVEEVIVVDDASSDDSVARLRRIDDPRVRIIALDRNVGGSESLNVGIKAARCPLIALCNSDDLWEPAKLEKQLPWLESDPNIGAVFTNVAWIGKYGEELNVGRKTADAFQMQNRSRHAWMRWLLENSNCFCHPSVLIRRSVYDQAGLYDNRLRQLPDYRMWLHALMHTEFHIMADKLVRFRIHDNTSTPSPSVSTRDRNECLDIMLDFMTSIQAKDFYPAFGSRLPLSDPAYNLDVEKCLYLWSMTAHVSPIAFWVANKLCMDLLATDAGKAGWEAYGFTMLDFHLLRGIESPWLNARESGGLTAAERAILRRVGANMGEQGSRPRDKRSRIAPRDKIKREIHRLGKQIMRILPRAARSG